jgi:cation:H+ antiporter
MLIDLIVIGAGIAAILILAELIIRHAIKVATYSSLSGTFIGMTILSIGTSIPEIMSHIVGSITILRQPETMASISGLLIGTNIGSDIFQQNFIFPTVGLVATITVKRRHLHDVMGGLLGAVCLALLVCVGGVVLRGEGLLLVVSYLAYLWYLHTRDQRDAGRKASERTWCGRDVSLPLLIIVAGFIVMAVVTEQVVRSSIRLVDILPISASFFGVIFLGIATSLPELATALLSITKGKKDMSAGIMLGSNVTNPLLGLGIGAMISTYTVPQVIICYDLPVNIATAILLYIFLLRKEDLNRGEAVTLLICYFSYLFLRWFLFPQDTLSLR